MEADPTHHIDRHILRVLTFQKTARYRDLRPPNTDSNLFNYHRKVLLSQGYITQNPDNTYTLGTKGLQLIERATLSDLRVRNRPKLSITFLLTNNKGEIAVWNKHVQPFIGTINLITGKMRFNDLSVMGAAERTLLEYASVLPNTMELAGTAEIIVTREGVLLVHALHMVVRAAVNPSSITYDEIYWISPKDIKQASTTPGVVEICADFMHSKQLAYKHYTFDT